jgi:uncharacterized membrane protein YfcA
MIFIILLLYQKFKQKKYTIMELIGYISSILIGISLGLIGSGGSILTVPVLVYMFGVDAVIATSVVFGIPSIVAVFLTRAYVVPAIPKEVFSIGDFMVTKSILMLLLFAILMIAASYSMIKKNKNTTKEDLGPQKFNYPVILIEGAIVGLVTGLVGAGGGFLIIPALVLLSKLPMKEAVGTSLVIIAAKSLIGFFGEGGDSAINWTLLAMVSAFATVGIFIGIYLSKKIDGAKLKPIFGWFVLLMGIYIIIKETLLK